MSITRRTFVEQSAVTGLAALTSTHVAQTSAFPARGGSAETGLRIKAAMRRDETTLRLGGVGDCFWMSWSADDRQYVGVNDGMGWLETPKGTYNTRMFIISESARDAVFHDLARYPDLLSIPNTNQQNRYYGLGILAIDGRIYQFLGTPNHHFFRPDGVALGARFVGAKLIYSPDNGSTWCNQDGSTPVVWEEAWEQRSRKNMMFFEEPQDAFSLPVILQMGRNYEANHDGYVYVYAPNGNVDGTMNELVMLRMPKAKILHRSAYEYFSGLRADGSPIWSTEILQRKPVCTFPRGWVNTFYHPWAWIPSLAYNAPLALYMMASWGTGIATDGFWFGKPSYLGLWVAPNPWGPWKQILEEKAWTPNNDAAARCYTPQIAPKWIAGDGKSFWIVWTDFQQKVTQDEFKREQEAIKRMPQNEQARAQMQFGRRNMPYYSFNTQRVDLVFE